MLFIEPRAFDYFLAVYQLFWTSFGVSLPNKAPMKQFIASIHKLEFRTSNMKTYITHFIVHTYSRVYPIHTQYHYDKELYKPLFSSACSPAQASLWILPTRS